MLSKASKFVRSHDLFGHVIHLNFNNMGDSHKTVIGGIGSLFVKTIMAIFIYISFEKLIMSSDDKNST